MSVEKEPRLTIGWRVETADVPDYEQCEWHDNWAELHQLVDYAGKYFGERLAREDLCDIENEMAGDTLIIGMPTARQELAHEEFVRDLYTRAQFAREVYAQVMRKLPEDGPYMISWTKVW